MLSIIAIIILPKAGISLMNALKEGAFGYFWKPHTVMILNHSTALIERYKGERGEYPVKLEHVKDILEKDEIFFHGDPMGPMIFGEKLRPLHYERLEDGKAYYLFGIGLDAEPFSKDDVYPNQKATNNSAGYRKPDLGAITRACSQTAHCALSSTAIADVSNNYYYKRRLYEIHIYNVGSDLF